MSKQIELLEVVRQAKDALQENMGLHNDAQETISSLRELCFALHDKAKKNLDKIRQCINGKIRVRYGSKNQEQSTAKIGQRKINSTALARKFRQGSTSEVIN